MLSVGAVIYIISRNDIIFFDWIPCSFFEKLKFLALDDTSMLGYFVVYCLPDGLWYGALLVFQSIFLGKGFVSRCLYWISIILPFVWEVLQIREDVSGTFDAMDLLVYFLTLTIFIIFSHNRYEQT